MQSHFWLGSLCGITHTEERRRFSSTDTDAITFPINAIAFTDTITILQDQGNQIPDKSWMLYVMEIFDAGLNRTPIELNLICQFNERDNFWAIFGGINRYKFTEVLPSVRHSYLREIIMNKGDSLIEYRLTDLNERKTEEYNLKIDNVEHNLCYRASNQFTGLEWWNKVDSFPFPIRHSIEITNLKFAYYDLQAGQFTFTPYNTLLPNKDDYAKRYPISFSRLATKDNCICYTLARGTCNRGLRFIST
jgi:hypothetical protein